MNTPGLAWRLSPQLYAWRVRRKPKTSDALPAFIDEGFTDAAYAGYDGVEFGLSVLRTPGRIPAVAELLHLHGLTLAALFCTVSSGADEQIIENLVRQAGRSLSIGCRFLNVATVQDRRSAQTVTPQSKDHHIEDTVRIMEALGARLAERDLRVCWHPHEEDFRNGGEGLLRVLNATGINHVSVCLDLGWILRASENPVSLLSACGERLGMLHVRDLDDGVWCQAIGEGLLDLYSIAAILKQLRYDGWISVELWFDRATRFTRSLRENARISAEVLRPHFK